MDRLQLCFQSLTSIKYINYGGKYMDKNSNVWENEYIMS